MKTFNIKTHRNKAVTALFFFLMMYIPMISISQVTVTGTYTQNFDGMGTGTTIPQGWSHIGRLGGSANSWTTTIPSSGSPSAASAGTVDNTLIVATNNFSGSSNNRAYNYSDANTTNRALGTSPTSGAGNILQLILTNGTGGSVSGLQLSYNIRRFANASSAESLPGYRLFVSVNGGTSWTAVSALNPTISTLPNTVGSSPFSLSLALPTPLQISGQLRLRWVDDNSANSSLDQRIGLDNVSITFNPPSGCGVPAGQLASALTTTSAALSWLPVTGAISYNLRWRPLSSTTFTNVSGLTATTYSLTGLQPSTSYEFQVQAVCSSGIGNFAPLFNFITPAVNPACAAAINLNANNITSTSALLSWSAGGPDSDYFILFWKPVNAPTYNSQNNLQSLSWQLNGLLPGTNYVFQVQTICGAVAGEPAIPAELSAPFFFTTSLQRMTQSFTTATGNNALTFWPNPNRGEQLELKLDQLDASISAATVAVFDLFGKQIANYNLPVSNGLLSSSLNLPEGLAEGQYILMVTAGDKQFKQRLIIQ